MQLNLSKVSVHRMLTNHIVDRLICRDSADTQYMLIQISQNLQNS